MEHRWGIRRTLAVGVKLYVPQRPPGFGRLLNASSSGAYVATRAKLPIMSRVHVALGWDESQGGGRHRIAAHVVRVDTSGIGIEWAEFAPAPVVALIDTLESASSRERRHAPLGGERSPVPHYAAQHAVRPVIASQ
jgi:hypothetical protein